MAAARSLSPPLKAATYETLIGLLTYTGLRFGEAAGLDRDDVTIAEAEQTTTSRRCCAKLQVANRPNWLASAVAGAAPVRRR